MKASELTDDKIEPHELICPKCHGAMIWDRGSVLVDEDGDPLYKHFCMRGHRKIMRESYPVGRLKNP